MTVREWGDTVVRRLKETNDLGEAREIAQAALADLAHSGDVELAHVYADAILCEMLRKHGEGQLVDLFEDDDFSKWYA